LETINWPNGVSISTLLSLARLMLRLEMAEGSPVSDKSANTDDKAAELMDFFEVSEAKDIK